jgi:phosphoglycolate phosphatase
MIRNLLFDLDGTLVDSSGTIATALEYALKRAGVPAPEPARLRSFIGRPLLDIFMHYFGMDAAGAERAIGHYRMRYERLGRNGSRVYDHVPECLIALGRAGFRLYVATVKPAPIAERVLGDFSLRELFAGVAGSSLDSTRRHKRDIIGHALETFALPAQRSLMIGDRAEDVLGARHHGLDAIAVAYGFGAREELEAAQPLHVAAGFDEVAAWLLARAPK